MLSISLRYTLFPENIMFRELVPALKKLSVNDMLALKELGIKAQCRVMTFNDELDEKESLIEFNKQRVKNASQIYNESTTLRSIYSERARKRQADAGKIYGVGQKVVVNLPQPIVDSGKTRQKLVEATGVKETKLETILDIGELAETGKILIAKEKAEKERIEKERLAREKAKKEREEHEHLTRERYEKGKVFNLNNDKI